MPVFTALHTNIVRAYQADAPDAYGQPPERQISDSGANPCRHCLRNIPKGMSMLVLAHRPFRETQPYAETGPIFLCAAPCERGGGDGALPEILTTSPDYLVKGYSRGDRIVYGTGAVVPATALHDRIADVFARPDVAYIHIRSARNNCYQVRVDRDIG